MAENGSELRKIAWSQAFPFVRLFQTFRLALNVNRLALAFCCVLLSYGGGRLLDALWGAGGGVATLPRESGLATEIDIYATRTQGEFSTWLREARATRAQRGFLVLRDAGLAKSPEEAQRQLAEKPLRQLVVDDKLSSELTALETLVGERLAAGLSAIEKNTELGPAQQSERRQNLIEAADALRTLLSGAISRTTLSTPHVSRMIEALIGADAQADLAKRTEDQARLTTAAARMSQLRQYEQLDPRGPFIELLRFEERCFAAAIQGVCAGRWGFAGGTLDPQPALAGSIVSAVRGVCWLLNQRLGYALLYGLFLLLVCAYFGGAICRSAAVESAREERISLGEALRFARERYGGLVLAPLLPVAVFCVLALALFVGGLIGAIPWLGELVTGLFYPLALLGGLALAMIALATVLGFHLMWPTIAAEGSDGFDALSRACSYVGSRIWHVGFYSFVLLVYGAASFVLVRLVAVLLLKLAHKFTGLGMNVVSSAKLSGGGKLDVLWSMPPWADLSVLPATGDVPFWGSFFNGPLDTAEWLGAALLALWVFAVVGVVGAFAVSFFYCGSTQMYFLLRREVDATDFDEVYYEEPAEELPPAATAEAGPPATGNPPLEGEPPDQGGA